MNTSFNGNKNEKEYTNNNVSYEESPILTIDDIDNLEEIGKGPSEEPFFNKIKRGRGRPKSDTVKELVTLRLSPNVIDFFKSTGPKWRTKINEELEKIILTDNI